MRVSRWRPAPRPDPVLTGWGAVGGDPAFARALAAIWLAVAGSEGAALARHGVLPSASVRAPEPPHDTSERQTLVDLVERAQAGDADAYGRIYALNVDSVYRFVHSRVGDRQLAEDLTSETFLRGLRRIDSFSWQGRDMVAWFITIARNLILDHVKSARTRMETTTGEMWDADEALAGVDESVIESDRARRLLSALAQLKPEQAECLSLRFLHERNLAETAEILGRTEGAVKQLQLRAIRALREVIGDDSELATW